MTIDASVLTHVSAIEPYVPGKPIAQVAREFGLDPGNIIKLASNENSLGASPAALRSLSASAADAYRYPDNECFDLRAGLARHLQLPSEQIIVGGGSSELIVLAARAFLAPGRRMLMARYSFVSYESAARSVGADTLVVPTRGWQPDLEAMLNSIDASVKLIFLASPNNPTGVLVEPAAIARFVAAVPDDVLVVLDEAYRDFVEPELRVNWRTLIERHPNVLVMRTFSKVYGLAGLRVGFGMGSTRLISLLRRLQAPFSVSVPAQSAALAALSDTEFVARSVETTRVGRTNLCEQFDAGGFEYIPSYGNFVLVRVGNGMKIFQLMLRRGIVVRPVVSYALPEWIRVTVGLRHENEAFLAALRDLLPEGSPR